MIVLHVVGGLLAVRHQREIGDDVSRFSLFPPVVRAESVVVHSLLVLLQFVHLVSVYGANLLSVSTVHSINVFLYSHLTHLSRHVSKLLTRKRAASGAVWNAANSDQGANVRPWNELLEAHSLLWDLQHELQISFNECGVLTHLAGLLDMCLTSYICIRVTSQYGMDWMTTLVCFGFMLPSGICILFESKSVDIVRNANAAIFRSNYGSSWSDLHPRELELANILMQRSREPMQLTAIDLFDISMRNFGAVVSLTVTYVIILIQFNS
ncbi:uncharacterized protein LOC122372232 [Amphibalanus amphitrite]|uniref:uncharacterized protein LOC122372232 n=1 Tax=Amphibalanus amphitrite TaxID=1232801 RepID=UPI001C909C42|nr:uncharacterized protein LOC122372232 [Amphibalanus amphitrite]